MSELTISDDPLSICGISQSEIRIKEEIIPLSKVSDMINEGNVELTKAIDMVHQYNLKFTKERIQIMKTLYFKNRKIH